MTGQVAAAALLIGGPVARLAGSLVESAAGSASTSVLRAF